MEERLFKLAKKDIVRWFADHSPGVFSHKEIGHILAEHRDEWRLSDYITTRDAIDFLVKNTELREVALAPINHKNVRPEKRYVWGNVSPFRLALSLKPQAYLTHATAMFLHGLSDQIPQRIYVNKEQSLKRTRGGLTQESIDRAFSSKQRESTFLFRIEDSVAVLLWGKNTGRLEVGPFPHGNENLEVTRIERTLIDVAVRPTYAGGVYQVLEAYRRAATRISVGTLIATLRKIGYVYPYHQTIGYYMELAGYPQSQYERLREFGLSFNFYLTYGLKEADYNEKWRLFVPKGFQ
jgi:hypothetical protein